jgi:uncharacterized damage-inducible protein DinB
MGHVLSLPGCITLGPTPDLATSRVGEAILDHFIWLEHHGEKSQPTKSVRFEVIEHMVRGKMTSGGEMALFTHDCEPLTKEDIDRFLNLLSYSRSDLLKAIESVPKAARNWSPNEKIRSFNRILRHVRNGERWYVTRIREDFKFQRSSPNPMTALSQAREDFIAFAKELTQKEHRNIYVPRNNPSYNRKEEWTARKALRRALEHEREHTANILQRLDQYNDSIKGTSASEPIDNYLVRLGVLL